MGEPDDYELACLIENALLREDWSHLSELLKQKLYFWKMALSTRTPLIEEASSWPWILSYQDPQVKVWENAQAKPFELND